ncbi:hypothetical protein F4804DRAFT_335339 [Jackrogersella minutella]|nr:hypothetical protein F4804DRAFT_335339 [Jackrogersella minutella]
MATDNTLSTVEGFILLGISLAIIALRTYVRVASVGWEGAGVDDYVMLLVAFSYSALIASTYIALSKCRGLANNDMLEDERKSLDIQSEEYSLRVLGTKLEMVSRILYTVVLWLTKAAMLAFCQRLTERLGQYRTRIRIGFAILGITWLADFLITMLSCGPVRKNWQIYPDPGESCYPATSPYSLFGTLSFNIATSLYVLFVPLPILWMANIKLWKKIGLIMLVSANGFVIAVAILRAYLITASETNGARQANRWAYRVCFVAVVTTNLPLLFPLLRRFLLPVMEQSPHTLRQIRTISVCSHARLTVRRPSRRMWNTGFRPGSSQNGCLTNAGFDGGRSMVDTGIDVNSIDGERSPDLEGQDMEMTDYDNQVIH